MLSSFTGSDHFGLSLRVGAETSDFDPRYPVNDVYLSWDSFDEMALQAGMSRIFGGIHFDQGNYEGIVLGDKVGSYSYDLAESFMNGEITEKNHPYYDWFVS